MKSVKKVLTLIGLAASSPLHSGESEQQAYVINNVIATFYHELGHGFIDIYDLPVLGQEEDAADVLSAVLIEELYEAEDVESFARDIVMSYQSTATELHAGGYEPAFWDIHGTDEQRAFNHICLFYGADPENREGFADFFTLPDERKEWCPSEYEKAQESWMGIVNEILPASEAETPWMNFTPFGVEGTRLQQTIDAVLTEEVSYFRNFGAAEINITVKFESCGEENAFYDPETQSIQICTELVDYYESQAVELGL